MMDDGGATFGMVVHTTRFDGGEFAINVEHPSHGPGTWSVGCVAEVAVDNGIKRPVKPVNCATMAPCGGLGEGGDRQRPCRVDVAKLRKLKKHGNNSTLYKQIISGEVAATTRPDANDAANEQQQQQASAPAAAAAPVAQLVGPSAVRLAEEQAEAAALAAALEASRLDAEAGALAAPHGAAVGAAALTEAVALARALEDSEVEARKA